MDYKIYKDFDDYHIYEDGRVWSEWSNIFMTPAIGTHGYLYFNFCKRGGIKKMVSLHRLVGLFIPNPENKFSIDHINHNRLDNRIENLRWSDREEQEHNKPITGKNTSGVKGVSYDKFRCRWIAFLTAHKKLHQKRFNTKEEAIKYRRELEVKYLGEGYIIA